MRTQLADVRLQQGQVTAAIELYKEAVHIDPYATPAYLGLAHVYAMLKDRESELEMLDDVLKIDPGNDGARQERIKANALPQN